jgi:hypothetical protein
VTPEVRKGLTDSSVQAGFERKPLAKFPAAVAVARIQESGYHSLTADGYGRGAYSVVTTRDVETPEQMARLEKLPMLQGIAPINRLMLPPELKSDLELRRAAASLQADLLLVYTFDTAFHTNDFAEPLTLISLGFAPNKQTHVVTTASAVLMDTRNGYVYGVAEATQRRDGLTNAWGSDNALDRARRRTETEAFDKLVGELEKTWQGVIKRYAGVYPTAPAAESR